MFFYIIGILGIAYVIIEILQEIYKCLQPFPNIQQKYGKDCWAVVTGATDGIGKAYCQLLAQQNVNICMIIRNEEKAKAVIKELSIGSKSKFKYIIADFSRSREEGFFENIFKQIQMLDIGLLVNNVGLAYTAPLENYRDQDLIDMITVNCYPIVFLSKYVAGLMIKRKRSAIINLSSFAGRTPMAYNQVYSATKAFDDYFSKSIAYEFDNIDVLAHRPLYVTTAMTNYIKNNGFNGAISPQDCARGGLARLGLEHETHGHWLHRLLGKFMISIPEPIRLILIKGQLRKLAKKYK